MGNYSIETAYDIHIQNKSGSDKIVEFHMSNWQNYVLEITNHDTGATEYMYTGNGDRAATDISTNDRIIASMSVPNAGSAFYTIKITLVSGDPGGTKNFLKIQ